ncbi:hypothetical protein KC350_g11540 [Hortaea werneckii]|nr:hypothetical protein KC350_g11540 [Hortaea werneckii]
MSVDPEIESKCKEISTNYSACDVSDALLKLKIPQAGFLPDILPLNSNNNPNPTTIAAPLSTVLFVPKPQASPSPSSPPPFATPIPALLLNLTLTSFYIALGDFTTLTTFYGVASYLFYFASVLGLLILRVKEPDLPRPYKCWIFTPVVFCCFF